MRPLLLCLVLIACVCGQARAGSWSFQNGTPGAAWGSAPDALPSLKLARTGAEGQAVIYLSGAEPGDLDGLPLTKREYLFAAGERLSEVIFSFNPWHLDEALRMARERLGKPAEENAYWARFEQPEFSLTVLKKKAAIQAAWKDPANATAIPDKPEEAAIDLAKPEKDKQTVDQTKLLAYSLSMCLDKMDTLEQDAAQSRISFTAYSDAYAKLAKETEALITRHPKADMKLAEFCVVLNNLVADLSFLTQKILSLNNDATFAGSMFNSAVSGATGNYLGLINSITSYFGNSAKEEQIKNDVAGLRKRFAASREAYAKKLTQTRDYLKMEYGIKL